MTFDEAREKLLERLEGEWREFSGSLRDPELTNVDWRGITQGFDRLKMTVRDLCWLNDAARTAER